MQVHELYTGFLGAYRIHELQPGPLVVPVTRPDPSIPIGIVRSVCRVHLLKTIPSMYAATLLFVRASDFAIIGGAACDTGLIFTPLINAIADRDTDWGPQRYFRLDPGDGLLGIFQTYNVSNLPTEPHAFMAEIDILFAYVRINDGQTPVVQFVSPSEMAHNTTVPLTVIGDGFVPGATVEFVPTNGGINGVTAAGVTVVNPNRIDATVTASNAADHSARNIVVTNPGGRSGGLQNALVIT